MCTVARVVCCLCVPVNRVKEVFYSGVNVCTCMYLDNGGGG